MLTCRRTLSRSPGVEGQVVHVYVNENQAVKKGDVLFEIDPRPFEYQVALLEAKRVEAVQQVAELESDLSAAKAEDERLIAEEAYARVVNDQENAIYNVMRRRTECSCRRCKTTRRGRQASLVKSRAEVSKAEQALAARVGDEHLCLWRRLVRFAQAKLNLEWSRVYAPANGYVTNVQLREGCYIHIGAGDHLH